MYATNMPYRYVILPVGLRGPSACRAGQVGDSRHGETMSDSQRAGGRGRVSRAYGGRQGASLGDDRGRTRSHTRAKGPAGTTGGVIVIGT